MDDGEGRSGTGTAGAINLSAAKSAVDLTDEVHQLPCCIRFDGPSSVSQYFKPKFTGVEVEGLSLKEAHFRGRKLQGATIPLPNGYSGFVLGKKGVNNRKGLEMSEGSSDCWETSAKFKNITFWNHDSLPSQDDAVLRAFHWFSAAKAVPSDQVLSWTGPKVIREPLLGNANAKSLQKSSIKVQELIKPKELNIVWGKDERYWRFIEKDDGQTDACFAELLQVSWLEVTAQVANLEPGKKYSVGFRISFKEVMFGWDNCPIFLMAKVGKVGKYKWKKIPIDTSKKGRPPYDIPEEGTEQLIVEIPSTGDKTVYFGLYEVWSGKWKGGLKIHHAFVKEV